MVEIKVSIKENTEEAILKAFEVLSEASGEFESNNEEYLDKSAIHSIMRALRYRGEYLLEFQHFHTSQEDIDFRIKLTND